MTAFVTAIGTVAGIVLGWIIAVWLASDPAFVAGPVIAGVGVHQLLRRRGAAPRSAALHALAAVAAACVLAWAATELFESFSDAVGEVD